MTAKPHCPDASSFFESWKTARLQDQHRKPMGPIGLAQAEFIWGRWIAFCTAHAIAWHRCAPGDVLAFSREISPRKMGAASTVSPVTLRRYWRILNDLYAHAVLCGHLARNPAAEVMPAISEKTSSLALPPHMWAQLQAGLPSGLSTKALRNRLVLLLMMHCALTVTEIIALQLSSAQPLQTQPPAPTPTYTLQLSGSRPVQSRQLVLGADTSAALHDWLQARRSHQAGPLDRLIVGDANGKAITPKGLYNIAQAFIARCLPGLALAQAGPNTLRNTCISTWLNQGVDVCEIQRRCGLKDHSVLIRLQKHILPPAAL